MGPGFKYCHNCDLRYTCAADKAEILDDIMVGADRDGNLVITLNYERDDIYEIENAACIIYHVTTGNSDKLGYLVLKKRFIIDMFKYKWRKERGTGNKDV